MVARLPIDEVLPQLKTALAGGNAAVLSAAPGAGKTTRVPLSLLDENWLEGRKIVMLEPRRLAARSAARFMAAQLGEAVGATVGYRVRMDTKAGPRTRIEVVTEGVLTRMLQEDPSLEGVGLLIFDEYHERSLQADLGLALSLQAQALFREDLRLLVMSATLAAAPVARLMGDAPVIASEGRQFPVQTVYRPPARSGVGAPIEDGVAPVVAEALREREGDVLVFLPGMAEIRRVERRLRELSEKGDLPAARSARICPLHGSLPQEAQDMALAPAGAGVRKIVLATSVAETSLTVEGVTIVIDSGLSRVSRFSPRTGMSRLETVPVSMASADQRRGRAGRLAPGICYRLWSEEQERRLPAASMPEIGEADLAPLVLELAAWGVRDPAELLWLDPPPAPAVQQARDLLASLGALTADGVITPHGRDMAALGMHPRLAHMLLRAHPLGLGDLACEIAVLLGERDLFRPVAAGTGAARATPGSGHGAGGLSGRGGSSDADLRSRLEALHGAGPLAAEEAVRRRLAEEAARLKREFSGRLGRRSGEDDAAEWIAPANSEPMPSQASKRYPESKPSLTSNPSPASMSSPTPEPSRSSPFKTAKTGKPPAPQPPSIDEPYACGLLLAFAYPDRVGRRREGGAYLLSGGRGASFASDQPVAREPWIAAAEVEDAGPEGRIRLAAPLALEDVLRHFGDAVAEERIVEWDRAAGAVRARIRRKFGAILIDESPLPSPPQERVSQALIAGLREAGIASLPWTRTARQFQERALFARRSDPAWPDLSDDALLDTLETWLAPYVEGMRGLADLQRLNLLAALESLLPWDMRRKLDAYAPTHWTVPSGSRIPIDYADPQSPAIAVRLQELFGLPESPRIADGRVPLTLHLLSPAQRPVQVTRDLANFWRSTYFEVRKDLKGRYPKHHWPDNPLEAEATRRAKPRG